MGWFGFEKKIFCGPSVTVTGRRKALAPLDFPRLLSLWLIDSIN
jgi:hypothetical protein